MQMRLLEKQLTRKLIVFLVERSSSDENLDVHVLMYKL